MKLSSLILAAGLFCSSATAAKWHFYLTSKGSYYVPGGDAYMDFANGEGYKCSDRWAFNVKNTWSDMVSRTPSYHCGGTWGWDFDNYKQTGNQYVGYKASVDVIVYYANTSRRKNGVPVVYTGLSHTVDVDL
ncbi:hypothetical protein K493DRAFT_356898 [Basidiobolus meristosporus CBS 931.73]|uniref:Uncharacterized protein n=1 Tax=Basidiobolus meristosporus CBS 931.73 TaxID=1314790 RepID=A0A1Y1XX88_9FUNG|nr:hypothetical protein K493DRAFT_356898 [Basidiobolus meristosporus CBS 931.73]|eukprot:ORX90353.1 hypothetical protein K493DRAFT_356898 [Basidiobolus meristosporus CBS 931.73]